MKEPGVVGVAGGSAHPNLKMHHMPLSSVVKGEPIQQEQITIKVFSINYVPFCPPDNNNAQGKL